MPKKENKKKRVAIAPLTFFGLFKNADQKI
jgi:hypothetical protein